MVQEAPQLSSEATQTLFQELGDVKLVKVSSIILRYTRMRICMASIFSVICNISLLVMFKY
jgi:hypothetical protein